MHRFCASCALRHELASLVDLTAKCRQAASPRLELGLSPKIAGLVDYDFPRNGEMLRSDFPVARTQLDVDEVPEAAIAVGLDAGSHSGFEFRLEQFARAGEVACRASRRARHSSNLGKARGRPWTSASAIARSSKESSGRRARSARSATIASAAETSAGSSASSAAASAWRAVSSLGREIVPIEVVRTDLQQHAGAERHIVADVLERLVERDPAGFDVMLDHPYPE